MMSCKYTPAFLLATPLLSSHLTRRCFRPRIRTHLRRPFSQLSRTPPPSPTAKLHPLPPQQTQEGHVQQPEQLLLEDELPPVESFRVSHEEAGTRIDKLLADRFNEKSRAYIQTLLASSCVTVDDTVTQTKSLRPVSDQLITVRFLPIQRDLPIIAEPIPIDVLYEDAHLVVIYKPQGMVVHSAPGNWTGTLVHALVHRFPDIAAQGGVRPGIVHRLDKGTSGLIVVARNLDVAAKLSELFAARLVRKDYIAITVGNPAGADCTGRLISHPMGRHPVDRLRMAVIPSDEGGRDARSTVHVIARDQRALLFAVRVTIETGRTHQIRVHCAKEGAPVLGDDMYGLRDINRRLRSSAKRPMLHAHRLAFNHPVTGDRVDVTAPLPDDMRSLMKRHIYPNFESVETKW